MEQINLKEEDDICSICLHTLDENKRYSKFTCNHFFHKNCINQWSGSCPLCRQNIVILTNNIVNENISGWKNIPTNVPLEYYSIYLEKWENTRCIDENHQIFFKHPYGVVGVCENCSTVQAFNLCHNC